MPKSQVTQIVPFTATAALAAFAIFTERKETMSQYKVTKAIEFERLFARHALPPAFSASAAKETKKLFVMKQIGRRVALGLLAMVASIGTLSAQTPFEIASVNSGLVLDLPDFSTSPGTHIQQYPVNWGTNQQWMFRRAPAAKENSPYPYAYEIVSVSSGQVLDVPNLSTTPGTLIQQYPANGGTNQQWRFSRTPGSSGYEIVSIDQDEIPSPEKDSFGTVVNLVLDVPNFSTKPGTVIQQWTENDGANQQWSIVHTKGPSLSTLSGSGDTITIAGYGFTPGTEVCPVFDSRFAKPCVTVLTNGTFSSATSFTASYAYSSAASGYVVVTVEDNSGNVLAFGSVTGGWVYWTQ